MRSPYQDQSQSTIESYPRQFGFSLSATPDITEPFCLESYKIHVSHLSSTNIGDPTRISNPIIPKPKSHIPDRSPPSRIVQLTTISDVQLKLPDDNNTCHSVCVCAAIIII